MLFSWDQGVRSRLVLAFFAAGCWWAAPAQSTYGTGLGTVKDPQGNIIALAKVELKNKGTNAARSALTNTDGLFEFPNVEVGAYELIVQAPGFQTTKYNSFDLGARESKRLEVDLKIATQATTVNAEAAAIGVQTDTSNVAETKSGLELEDLPIAIASRGTGSTNPISTLDTQPGVQIDSSGYISVGGATPTMLSLSIDRVSVIGARAGETRPITELFPSVQAIQAIPVIVAITPSEFLLDARIPPLTH